MDSRYDNTYILFFEKIKFMKINENDILNLRITHTDGMKNRNFLKASEAIFNKCLELSKE